MEVFDETPRESNCGISVCGSGRSGKDQAIRSYVLKLAPEKRVPHNGTSDNNKSREREAESEKAPGLAGRRGVEGGDGLADGAGVHRDHRPSGESG